MELLSENMQDATLSSNDCIEHKILTVEGISPANEYVKAAITEHLEAETQEGEGLSICLSSTRVSSQGSMRENGIDRACEMLDKMPICDFAEGQRVGHSSVSIRVEDEQNHTDSQGERNRTGTCRSKIKRSLSQGDPSLYQNTAFYSEDISSIAIPLPNICTLRDESLCNDDSSGNKREANTPMAENDIQIVTSSSNTNNSNSKSENKYNIDNYTCTLSIPKNETNPTQASTSTCTSDQSVHVPVDLQTTTFVNGNNYFNHNVYGITEQPVYLGDDIINEFGTFHNTSNKTNFHPVWVD